MSLAYTSFIKALTDLTKIKGATYLQWTNEGRSQNTANHTQSFYNKPCHTKGPPRNDLLWSVRSVLNFSYVPAINLAYEGSWAHGDQEGQLGLQTPDPDLASSDYDSA